MFPVSEFLIYCFITAYTPGANNLLSMNYAARRGFRHSFPFNLGITAGFLIVMTVCTVFSSTLYTLLSKVKPVMQVLGAAYMLYLGLESMEERDSRGGGSGKGSRFHQRYDSAIYES